MAGVEPASEEKTIKIPPYIVSLLILAPSKPTDRILREQPQHSTLSRGSPGIVKENIPAILSLSAPFWNSTGGIPQDGLLNV
jgi:hypothetical protein